MSARNYLSAREKNISKCVDYLPHINQQKIGYRTVQGLPPLSAHSASLINRNLGFNFGVQQYSNECFDRASTPFSDFFSDSETDFRSEESDSSSGSALQRNTEEATKTLEAEWEKIDRTLYDEEGEKTTRPHILEECKQWRQLHPQLRVIGKAIPLPQRRLSYRQTDKHNEHEEVIAVHYSDYEKFSESEERLSQSSTDVTPQNSPRVSTTEALIEPRLSREKISFTNLEEGFDFNDTFSSLLQITPYQIRSPRRKRLSHTIVRSEIASSKWMRGSRPDSSVNYGRSSAKSFVSLDTLKYGNTVSAVDTKLNSRVVTARHSDIARLQPISTPEPPHNDMRPNRQTLYCGRKVSLPPLSVEEEKRKITTLGSAKKQNLKPKRKVSQK